MTTYRKTMAESLKEVYLGEDNMALLKKAAGRGAGAGMRGSAQTLKMKDGNLKMDSFTASAIMQIYDKINDKNKKTFENMIKNGKKADIVKLMKFAMSKVNAEYVPEEFEEEFELDEAKYDLYHKDFSSAMQHAYKMAKKMYGITVDPKEIDDKVASGPKKPSEGKTNSYRLKGDKGAIQVQVYNKGGSKPFELNMYKEEVELDEKLDKEDEPTIKKVVKMLKKASGAHAGQAKDLEKAMTEEDEIDEGKMSQLHQLIKDGKSAKEIAKIMKLDVKTIQALMDEKSELEEKRHRDVDPADIDTSATDDDIKAADKNIMMQLRKSVSLRGQFPVEFLDKKKVKIPQRIAQAVIAKYNGLRKPMDKEVFQSKIAKSHRDLLMALKEGFASDAQRRAAFAQGYKAKGKKDKKEDIDETGYVGGKDPMPAGKELAKLMKKRRKGKKESTLERMNKKLQEKKDG